MKIDDAQIKKILVAENYVTEEEIAEAEIAAKQKNIAIIDHLIREGFISKDLFGQAMSEHFDVSYSDLNSNQPACEVIEKIPEITARKFRTILFAENKSTVTVTTDNPKAESLAETLKEIFPDKQVTITYSLSEDIDQGLLCYQKPLETRFSKIIEEKRRVAPEILEEIFEDAYTFHASDIHFEPQHEEVVVRFRVDGVLHEAGRLPKEHYDNILNRIKVQSQLRIDEHFAAQDGAMQYVSTRSEESGIKGIQFDLRTSIVPTVEGEKVVLRLLATYIQGLTLGDLGLTAHHQEVLERAARNPFGMILVTGPTGSGKSTTLYALLKMLNQPEVNITTIEDPVEYKIQGVNQIQVNQQTQLTFAKGLRSVVRQDPDIILVGEIRDTETAEIAVNAALTGHLLFSTFHANDTATAVPRLLDMDVEPFLLASTLELIIAQRLVRKICDSCRYSVSMTQDELKETLDEAPQYFPEKKITIYAGKGCSSCGHTGYHGRVAIFELIEVTPELQDLMLTNPSTREIWEVAHAQGTEPLFVDGIEKVRLGMTTLEELLRVAQPPREKGTHVKKQIITEAKKKAVVKKKTKSKKAKKVTTTKTKKKAKKEKKPEVAEVKKEKTIVQETVSKKTIEKPAPEPSKDTKEKSVIPPSKKEKEVVEEKPVKITVETKGEEKELVPEKAHTLKVKSEK